MNLLQAKKFLISGRLGCLKAATRPQCSRPTQNHRPTGAYGMAVTAAGRDPWMKATPRICLHDVPTTVCAGGLPPYSPVTLSASVTDEKTNEFCSSAHYVTDEAGDVDVRVAASVGGSYTGVFPAGLLTTLAPAPHEMPSLRLYRRDTSLPWKIKLKVLAGHQSRGATTETLAEVELERHLMAPGVRRLPVREGRVRGALYLPAGDGPFPGVIDMFGSIGGLMEFRSAMLASRGIACLALAFFAYDDLPKTTDAFELEYFEEAVEFLLRHDEVVRDRCGVIAVSKATDTAFCLATWVPQVKAVVSISGCPIVFDSVITHRGRTLLKSFKLDMNNMVTDQNGMLYPRREDIARHAKADHEGFVPFNLADDDTYFLMAAGKDDAWSCDLFLTLTRERMDSLGRGAWLETVEYPGAGHILEPPYGPLVYHSYHRYLPVVSEGGSGKVKGVSVKWGGNAKGTCRAQEDLWSRMRAFLTRHVRDNSPWYRQHTSRHH